MSEKKAKFRYLSIYKDIRDKIESGEFQPSDKLKTEKEYQEEYGVSRDTVRKAFNKLENEDYIIKKTAVGSFVKSKKSDYPLTRLESFSEQMIARGIEPSSEFVSVVLEVISNKYIREELNLEDDEKCYIITRIRKGDKKPMAYEIAYVPQKLCPDIQKYLDNHSSLYKIYEDVYHFQMGNGRMKLEAELPGTAIQTSLGISHYSPVLKMQCTVDLENGIPLYHVDCYYIGAEYYFTAGMHR
ncbi:MAG: GntR family transcriptional regulator [Eubacteriaceae bacterium]|jgi:GntR family transcriptional regulator